MEGMKGEVRERRKGEGEGEEEGRGEREEEWKWRGGKERGMESGEGRVWSLAEWVWVWRSGFGCSGGKEFGEEGSGVWV